MLRYCIRVVADHKHRSIVSNEKEQKEEKEEKEKKIIMGKNNFSALDGIETNSVKCGEVCLINYDLFLFK